LKTVVFVKRVPDTEARIRIGGNGSSIDPTGVKFIVNPYDEFAVEAALRLRDSAESGEVTVLSVGSAASAETLRTTLAMGADQAVLLKTDASPEGLATAEAIAAELRERDFDIALFGMKAIDDDLQAVGAMVAEILELPSATVVTEFAVDRGTVTAQRAIEGGIEVVKLKLPCILTITKGAYEPRYPSLKGIMAAKKKPLEEKAVEVTAAKIRVGSLEAPAERSAGRIVGEGPDAVPELLRLLREEARVI
jgi:electron transfer flavoprotein beta subunit